MTNNVVEIEHAKMVEVLVKSPATIHEELTPSDCNLIHSVLGISGEAGELLDAIKKATIYRKELDRANIVEELGDLEFYMEQIRQELFITREETLKGNMEKLAKRYEKFKYTDQQAQARADKNEPNNPPAS